MQDGGDDRHKPECDRDRAFLALAHPGHELLVHGWLCATRPRVLVLTDGSGRNGVSRMHATTALLRVPRR